MKICTQCGVEKSLDKFPRRDGPTRSTRNRCTECIKRSTSVVKTLRKEYSRWNALTNNSDKTIRERAREMRDLAANLRSQYTN